MAFGYKCVQSHWRNSFTVTARIWLCRFKPPVHQQLGVRYNKSESNIWHFCSLNSFISQGKICFIKQRNFSMTLLKLLLKKSWIAYFSDFYTTTLLITNMLRTLPNCKINTLRKKFNNVNPFVIGLFSERAEHVEMFPVQRWRCRAAANKIW